MRLWITNLSRVREIAYGFGGPSEKKCQSSLIFYCKIPILCQSLAKYAKILLVMSDRTDTFRELCLSTYMCMILSVAQSMCVKIRTKHIHTWNHFILFSGHPGISVNELSPLSLRRWNIRHFKFDFHRLKMADSLLLEEVT